MDNQRHTGTTTLGILCKDGVVLGADMRATAGRAIVQKDALKVHKISSHIAITWAGSVSDLQLLNKLVSAEISLIEIRTKRQITVKEAANLLGNMVFNNIRNFSPIMGVTHFLMGGHDSTGLHLYDIYPDGSVNETHDYVVSGSGSDFALGILEDQYKPGLSIADGVNLIERGITAAMARDSASGNGLKILSIDEDGVHDKVLKRVNYSLQAAK